jgi:hypothetical protein
MNYTTRVSHLLGFFGIITSEVAAIADAAYELEYDTTDDAEFIRNLMYTGIQDGQYHFGMMR